MVRILTLVLLVGCSKDNAGPAVADDSPHSLCARGCAKLLSCAPDQAKDDLRSCIETCKRGSPRKAQIEQIESMTCEQINTKGVPAAPGVDQPK